MKTTCNERGIALITALLITMISLIIVTGLLYTITQNIKMTGSQRIYRNAVEASYGGADMTMKEIMPGLFTGTSAGDIVKTYQQLDMKITDAECFTHKLFNDSSAWKSKCLDEKSGSPDLRFASDLEFTVKGPSNRKDFEVLAKIVDTSSGTPYLNPEGNELLGAGVTASNGSATTKGAHFTYRIEILGQKADNPAEKGRLSVLYEY